MLDFIWLSSLNSMCQVGSVWNVCETRIAFCINLIIEVFLVEKHVD